MCGNSHNVCIGTKMQYLVITYFRGMNTLLASRDKLVTAFYKILIKLLS